MGRRQKFGLRADFAFSEQEDDSSEMYGVGSRVTYSGGRFAGVDSASRFVEMDGGGITLVFVGPQCIPLDRDCHSLQVRHRATSLLY